MKNTIISFSLIILLILVIVLYGGFKNTDLANTLPSVENTAAVVLSNLKPSGPLVISGKNGQVISNISVSNPNGSCVIISGSSNIKIENSEIGPCKGGGSGIEVNGSNNVSIQNSYIHDTSYVGVNVMNSESLNIKNNKMENVASGVYALLSKKIQINNNEFLNVQGPFPRGQFVQFDKVTGPENQVSCNFGENILGKSYAEDAINIYASSGTSDSPILIRGNKIKGGGPSQSGGGIMTGDEQGSFIVVEDNILTDVGQYGIAIAGGNNIKLLNNKVYGKRQSFTNVGIYVWDAYSANTCKNHTVSGNKVTYTNSGGSSNPFWNSGTCGALTELNNNWNANLNDSIINEVIPYCAPYGIQGQNPPISTTPPVTEPAPTPAPAPTPSPAPAPTPTPSPAPTPTPTPSNPPVVVPPTTPEVKNQPPYVHAGYNTTITLPSGINLNGVVTDDGLPKSVLNIMWSKISGPAEVSFSNPKSGQTGATFPVEGVYTLKLTANDSSLTSSDEVVITVNPAPIKEVPKPLPSDTNPPVISNLKPNSVLPAGTKSVLMSFNTNEDALCKYGKSSGTYHSLLSTFGTTGGKSHSQSIVNLSDGSVQTFYIRCIDNYLNENQTDSVVTIKVDKPVVSENTIPAPIMYWTFNKSDITNKRVASDKSGNGQDITFYNSEIITSGKSGDAIKTNGRSSFTVLYDKYPLAQITKGLTISLWLKTTSDKTETLVSKYSASGREETGYIFKVDKSGKLALRLGWGNLLKGYNGQRELVDSGVSVNDGNWHHVALVIDTGKNIKFYVDGKLSSTQEVATKSNIIEGYLGLFSNPVYSYGGRFGGIMDEVKIFNNALSESQIYSLFNN